MRLARVRLARARLARGGLPRVRLPRVRLPRVRLSDPGFRVLTFLIERCCGHKVYMSAAVRRLLGPSPVLAHAVQGPRGLTRPLS